MRCIWLVVCVPAAAVALVWAAAQPPPQPAAKAQPKPKPVIVKVRVDSENGGYEGWRALDGNPQTMWHTEFGSGDKPHPHEIVVDLGGSYELSGFACLPREGGGNGTIGDYECCLSESDKDFGPPVTKGRFQRAAAENVVRFAAKAKGRYLRLRALSEVNRRPWTSIAELRPLAEGISFRAAQYEAAIELPDLPEGKALTELDRQYAVLMHHLRNRARFARFAPQTHRVEALILDGDRDPADVVLRRTGALLAEIRAMVGAPDLSASAAELGRLQAAVRDTPIADAAARRKLFDDACGLRRRIALANPLLNFDKLLFLKRHRSTFNHMCDQYYGINAVPGGGLCVLSDPFGPAPKVRDLTAGAVVQRGRLQGARLEGGSFVTPDLSYDGQTILFAYVECTGSTEHTWHTETDQRGYWSRGRSYHIFRVNADGSGLEQLTDGTWNDFAPCWLPNGRAAFISERRGGYLRCGRVCPTYTLYDMAADGSDIRCLSFHETNEWHPSITHDGMILYTRWDYIDRHGCTAHLPWVTTPDGRDARAVHGNFAPRPTRPDMEMNVRAIPGSRKLIATAAPHHGQAFGSLVLIDPAIEDDDAMGPVKRLTPDVGFPESQGGAQAYGTAWPLSENFYLCAYDGLVALGEGRSGMQGRSDVNAFCYGIYLVDSFGNRELIYRDPNIASQSPIPLRPRPRPPTVPALARRAPAGEAAEATLSVVNAYDSLRPWPAGTRIAALRIYQIIPMSVPSGGPPHEIGLREPTSTDSVVLARYVIGTVPVEADGSAHFAVPARKELFFQALDANGLAVQSMRSATYLQPGEHLVCQGCHEPKSRSPQPPPTATLAQRRPASRPRPDVDGTNPFSYPRLVQPVLEKHCVACHTKNADKAPRLDREVIGRGAQKWYASYHSLAPKYGFWSYGQAMRTTPGKFGARASKLHDMLARGHHDLKLPAEDLHRIAVWLDSCSIFYGVYEKDGGEAQLRGEVARPTLE